MAGMHYVLAADGSGEVQDWQGTFSEYLEWKETRAADVKDHRIKQWSNHETERLEYISNKKRKFVHL